MMSSRCCRCPGRGLYHSEVCPHVFCKTHAPSNPTECYACRNYFICDICQRYFEYLWLDDAEHRIYVPEKVSLPGGRLCIECLGDPQKASHVWEMLENSSNLRLRRSTEIQRAVEYEPKKRTLRLRRFPLSADGAQKLQVYLKNKASHHISGLQLCVGDDTGQDVHLNSILDSASRARLEGIVLDCGRERTKPQYVAIVMKCLMAWLKLKKNRPFEWCVVANLGPNQVRHIEGFLCKSLRCVDFHKTSTQVERVWACPDVTVVASFRLPATIGQIKRGNAQGKSHNDRSGRTSTETVGVQGIAPIYGRHVPKTQVTAQQDHIDGHNGATRGGKTTVGARRSKTNLKRRIIEGEPRSTEQRDPRELRESPMQRRWTKKEVEHVVSESESDSSSDLFSTQSDDDVDDLPKTAKSRTLTRAKTEMTNGLEVHVGSGRTDNKKRKRSGDQGLDNPDPEAQKRQRMMARTSVDDDSSVKIWNPSTPIVFKDPAPQNVLQPQKTSRSKKHLLKDPATVRQQIAGMQKKSHRRARKLKLRRKRALPHLHRGDSQHFIPQNEDRPLSDEAKQVTNYGHEIQPGPELEINVEENIPSDTKRLQDTHVMKSELGLQPSSHAISDASEGPHGRHNDPARYNTSKVRKEGKTEDARELPLAEADAGVGIPQGRTFIVPEETDIDDDVDAKIDQAAQARIDRRVIKVADTPETCKDTGESGGPKKRKRLTEVERLGGVDFKTTGDPDRTDTEATASTSKRQDRQMILRRRSKRSGDQNASTNADADAKKVVEQQDRRPERTASDDGGHDVAKEARAPSLETAGSSPADNQPARKEATRSSARIKKQQEEEEKKKKKEEEKKEKHNGTEAASTKRMPGSETLPEAADQVIREASTSADDVPTSRERSKNPETVVRDQLQRSASSKDHKEDDLSKTSTTSDRKRKRKAADDIEPVSHPQKAPRSAREQQSRRPERPASDDEGHDVAKEARAPSLETAGSSPADNQPARKEATRSSARIKKQQEEEEEEKKKEKKEKHNGTEAALTKRMPGSETPPEAADQVTREASTSADDIATWQKQIKKSKVQSSTGHKEDDLPENTKSNRVRKRKAADDIKPVSSPQKASSSVSKKVKQSQPKNDNSNMERTLQMLETSSPEDGPPLSDSSTIQPSIGRATRMRMRRRQDAVISPEHSDESTPSSIAKTASKAKRVEAMMTPKDIEVTAQETQRKEKKEPESVDSTLDLTSIGMRTRSKKQPRAGMNQQEASKQASTEMNSVAISQVDTTSTGDEMSLEPFVTTVKTKRPKMRTEDSAKAKPKMAKETSSGEHVSAGATRTRIRASGDVPKNETEHIKTSAKKKAPSVTDMAYEPPAVADEAMKNSRPMTRARLAEMTAGTGTKNVGNDLIRNPSMAKSEKAIVLTKRSASKGASTKSGAHAEDAASTQESNSAAEDLEGTKSARSGAKRTTVQQQGNVDNIAKETEGEVTQRAGSGMSSQDAISFGSQGAMTRARAKRTKELFARTIIEDPLSSS